MLNRKIVACLVIGMLLLPATAALAQTPDSAPAKAIAKPIVPEQIAPVDANAPSAVIADANRPTTTAPADKGLLSNWPLLAMLGAIFVLFILSGRGRRKQESKRKEMISSMKKGDRVTTIGGIIGTVIEVKPDEIIVKVDEQNNVRMHFVPSAIHNVGDVKTADKK